jgi:predicted CxxxxCH...CXXCH cytochrome family protein
VALFSLLGATACSSVRDWRPDSQYLLHGPGFADPQNPASHGKLLRASAYDLNGCSPCHGADFLGGGVWVSCAQCHTGGPTACTTCHGQPPLSGAHAKHVAKYTCETCHTVPARWDAPGHIDGDGVPEVTFSGTAVLRGAYAVYRDGRCGDTYCHGTSFGSGALSNPSWTAGPAATACGNCHGIPPPNHPGEACHVCHGEVVDAQRNIARPDLHADGVIQVRDLSAGCSACHGPPQDLGGAHTRHLAGGGLGKPVACGECHAVPATIGAAGHIDATPGAELTFGPLARQGGLMPTWDGTRCSGTYCHGASLRGGGNTTPTWQNPAPGKTCGGCHGVPMESHFHNRCNECHGSVVNRLLEIVDPSLHINGQVDLGYRP